MQITKIKIENDQTATIEYNEKGDMETKQVIYSGKEKITEEFDDTFQKSVNSFVAICPALKKETSNITMNSITFSYGKNEKIEKVSYTVKYKPQSNVLANIPVNNVPIYKEEFSEKTFSVSGKDENLLYTIIEFAEKYIGGDTRTKQMKIFTTEG